MVTLGCLHSVLSVPGLKEAELRRAGVSRCKVSCDDVLADWPTEKTCGLRWLQIGIAVWDSSPGSVSRRWSTECVSVMRSWASTWFVLPAWSPDPLAEGSAWEVVLGMRGGKQRNLRP